MTRLTVPFFSQARTFERIWPDIRSQVEEVFEDGKFSHSTRVRALEQALTAYTGARHVIGVNSGTDALALLLKACGLRPGDRVLVPAYSFVATATSVVHAGGEPVFADVDPDSYALDPARVPDGALDGTRFVMPVHLFSRMADMAALTAFASARGLELVEDSAEGIGMRQAGVHAGLHGRGGVLSFFPGKTLGALGDAGAVLTDDPGIAERVAALRHHGRTGRTLGHFPGISHESVLPGHNSKMDDLQAAILLARLTVLDGDIRRRADLAARYDRRLRGLPGITRLPRLTGAPDEVFYVYLIEADHRDALAGHLAAGGIGTEVYYPRPLHLQPCFARLGHRPGDFPAAEAAAGRALALPLYPDLTDEQADRVCDAVEEFLTRKVSA
ncbi:DegT/DnrJ/EryC1/StrS family aminotransferase [Streptomyces sp. SHP 1-2]|uniref:DegT/DnrJ/EryC1/StrS family aminotransferase n=1 Tax=Streptomyces sp. SHP 1-2 TaxID=2769489 RepID=UPI002238AAB0|nr:DegT/DnrJ/EryC1/StrS family aminotransferase [Streptomyces sp. SHP 1-2]MCW5249616.1 DegT/DnrJ/EryC1/StrS family aminotransferase [Streptomyces sp. SHP 1-2]